MPKYISNYVILPDSTVLHNHIVSVDSGCLVGVEPLSGELAYTIYVPNPIVVVHQDLVPLVERLFESSAGIDDFCNVLAQSHLSCCLESGKQVQVIELDFCDHYATKLV